MVEAGVDPRIARVEVQTRGGAPQLGMASGTPSAMASAAMKAVAGFQTITSGYGLGDSDSYHSMAPPWNAVDIGGTNLRGVFNHRARRFGNNVRELIYEHTLIEKGQRFHYAPDDHFDHIHVADMGKIVKGPALIAQGNLTEAHIPLTGPHAYRYKGGGDTINITIYADAADRGWIRQEVEKGIRAARKREVKIARARLRENY
jgi:hypothetical protein